MHDSEKVYSGGIQYFYIGGGSVSDEFFSDEEIGQVAFFWFRIELGFCPSYCH
jgi:hypothetical protein